MSSVKRRNTKYILFFAKQMFPRIILSKKEALLWVIFTTELESNEVSMSVLASWVYLAKQNLRSSCSAALNIVMTFF